MWKLEMMALRLLLLLLLSYVTLSPLSLSLSFTFYCCCVCVYGWWIKNLKGCATGLDALLYSPPLLLLLLLLLLYLAIFRKEEEKELLLPSLFALFQYSRPLHYIMAHCQPYQMTRLHLKSMATILCACITRKRRRRRRRKGRYRAQNLTVFDGACETWTHCQNLQFHLMVGLVRCALCSRVHTITCSPGSYVYPILEVYCNYNGTQRHSHY